MRFGGTLLVTLVALLAAAPAAAQLAVGARVRVTQDAAVRPTPGGSLLGIQPIGAQGVITAGPQGPVWGYTWWQINFDTSFDGWVTADRLQLMQAYPGGVAVLQLTRREVGVWTVAWAWQDGNPSLTVADLERGPTGTGPWTPLITTAAGVTFYDDRAVVAGQRYCYRARGRIGTDATPFSIGVCTP
jgi:hypothetical protein